MCIPIIAKYNVIMCKYIIIISSYVAKHEYQFVHYACTSDSSSILGLSLYYALLTIASVTITATVHMVIIIRHNK